MSLVYENSSNTIALFVNNNAIINEKNDVYTMNEIKRNNSPSHKTMIIV